MDTYNYVKSNFVGTVLFRIEIMDDEKYDFKCISMNKAFEDIFQINKIKALGQSYTEILGSSSNYLTALFIEVIQMDKEVCIETGCLVINKKLRVCVFKTDNDVILMQVYDLEEQNEHYKEVYKYKLLFDNSLDSTIIFKASGEIMDCNRAALREYGYLRSELLKLKIFNLTKKNEEQSMEEIDRLCKENGTKLEEAHYKKDGSKFPVEVKYIEVGVKDGKLIFAIIRNIANEKQKNKEIERLSLAVEQSSSPVIITDSWGNIEYVNDKFQRITGYNKSEIIGKRPEILGSGFPFGKVYKEMWKTIKLGNDWIGEFRGKRKDGTEFWWSASISPVKDNENNILNYLAVTEDITEKKELIDNLNRKNNELNSTLEVLKNTQVKLMQDDKMATIGQLSAGIAHEINNPLGFVLSNLNTLKKYIYKFEDTIKEYRSFKLTISDKYNSEVEAEIKAIEEVEKVNKIDYIENDLGEIFGDTNEGIERIRNIVNALRSFAHENLNDDKSDYDLNDGIKNTLTIARNETKYTSKVFTNLSDIPMISANGGEINQVLLNLIVNASHAIKEKMEKENTAGENYGKIEITSNHDSKFVYCSIEDNGIGIKQEYINKVIEPFFTTKPVGQGSGLGLSISYEIIKTKHKGELIIDSVEGKGTKITIKIPIK